MLKKNEMSVNVFGKCVLVFIFQCLFRPKARLWLVNVKKKMNVYLFIVVADWGQVVMFSCVSVRPQVARCAVPHYCTALCPGWRGAKASPRTTALLPGTWAPSPRTPCTTAPRPACPSTPRPPPPPCPPVTPVRTSSRFPRPLRKTYPRTLAYPPRAPAAPGGRRIKSA